MQTIDQLINLLQDIQAAHAGPVYVHGWLFFEPVDPPHAELPDDVKPMPGGGYIYDGQVAFAIPDNLFGAEK